MTLFFIVHTSYPLHLFLSLALLPHTKGSIFPSSFLSIFQILISDYLELETADETEHAVFFWVLINPFSAVFVVPSTYLQSSVFHFILQINSVPWHTCTTFSLTIYQLKDM